MRGGTGCETPGSGPNALLRDGNGQYRSHPGVVYSAFGDRAVAPVLALI